MVYRQTACSTSIVSRYLSSTAESAFGRVQSSRTLTTGMSSFPGISPSFSEDNDFIKNYKSPYNDYFERIKQGKTGFGTDASQRLTTPEEKAPRLKCGIPETKLQFRTVSYGRYALPPFVHANEHKVSLKVNVNDLPLHSQLELDIMKQIVSDRYISETNELRLTSNQFASRIENKRHLCSMLDRIVLGAQRLAREVQQEGENEQDQEGEQEHA